MKFNDPQHALGWAYETCSRPIVKISSVNAMRGTDGGGEGANGELTAYDRHAQAALILGLCERILPALHMAYISVQFGREASGFDLLVRHLTANFRTEIATEGRTNNPHLLRGKIRFARTQKIDGVRDAQGSIVAQPGL